MKKMENIKVFLSGMAVAMGLVFIMGAGNGGSNIGRYQVSCAGGGEGEKAWYECVVIDTTTGSRR